MTVNVLVDRLRGVGLEVTRVEFSSGASGLDGRRWLAITSSHLGTSSELQAQVCRYVSRTLLEVRRSGEVLLVAAGSAIEPWATRAAQLFSVPLILVHTNPRSTPPASAAGSVIVRGPGDLCRDAVLIHLADRVDCVFVRAGGTIESCLTQRLGRSRDASVRVAIHADAAPSPRRCVERLMTQGAIGWYCRSRERAEISNPATAVLSESDWTRCDGEWLVHCTRAPRGPWPGQSDRQHRDSLLLGGPGSAPTDRTAFASLRRIVRDRRLVAAAMTSKHAYSVVCFSEQSLAGLLSRRCYRPHLHRWDYEPYGIAIRKSAAIEHGFAPVVYGEPEERSRMADGDRYRFQAIGRTYDWSTEREWRKLGDVVLEEFDVNDIRVFVPSESEAARLGKHFPVSVVADCVS